MPDFIDDVLPTDQQLQDAEDAGKAVGKGKKDFEDDDQDAKDKARNVTDDATDALDALGLHDAADAIEDATSAIFGPEPPDTLPPLHYRVYFGEKGMVDALKDNLLSDGLAAADALAKDVLSDVPVLGELAEDPFSSFLAPKDKDEDESHWMVRSFDLSEGLNELFRCEILMARVEVRSPLELVPRSNPDGGFLDTVKSAVAKGQGMVQDAQNLANQVAAINDVDDVMAIADGLMGGGGAGTGTDGPVPNINLPLDPALFLNQPISISVSRDLADQGTKSNAPDIYRYPWVKRWVTGIVTEFQDLGVGRGPPPANAFANPAAEGLVRAVRIVVRPSLYKLALRKNHRCWQDYTALEIVHEVLREAGIYGLLPAVPGASLVTGAVSEALDGIPAVGSALASTASGQKIKLVPPAGVPESEWTPKREHCCQFGETDLDFLRRLLEEEGITFLSLCTRGEERLVLVDDVSGFPEAPTIDGRAAPFVYAFDSTRPQVEYAYQLRQSARLRSTRVTLRDFNFSNQALRPDRVETAVGGSTQAPLANPPLMVNVPAGPTAAPAPAPPPPPVPDSSSGLPGAPPGGVGGGQPFGTIDAAQALGTDGTELEVYGWPARAVYPYEEEPEKPDPDVARHYRRYDPTAAPPSKKDWSKDAKSPDRDLVRLRLEALVAESQVTTVRSNLAGAIPGTILLLKGYWLNQSPDSIASPKTQRLLVRRARAFGGDRRSTDAPPDTDEWFLEDAMFGNVLELQWLDPDDATRTPYRPPLRTPRPVVTGVQTATVVDTSMHDPEDVEQQIHSDHRTLGRVMVRFHWDRRGENPLGINIPFDLQGLSRGHTAWIRVSQTWAGDDFGVSFVPRVGMEVIVGFEDGNPDRPLILGCVYNGLEVPPLDPDKERTHSIVRTQPNPYDDAAKEGPAPYHNELRFVDDRDAEEIRLDARRYLVEEVRNDMWTRVVHDQTNEVDGNHGELVLGYQHLEVSGDREKTVGKLESVEVRGQRAAEVHGSETLEVRFSRDQTIHGVQTVAIGKPDAGLDLRRTLEVYGTRETHIGDPLDPEVGPCNDTFTVEGAADITVTGAITVLAGSFGAGTPAAPGSPVNSAGVSGAREEDVEGEKDTLAIRSDKDETLEAKGEIVLRSEHCGAKIEAGDKIEVVAGPHKVVLDGSSATGVLSFESPKSVSISCAGSKIDIAADRVLLSAAGSPAAELVLNAAGMGLRGGSLAFIMRNTIEINGGAIKV